MNIRDHLAKKTAARKPSGMYGFTKRTQSDCETASRAIQRTAQKVARRIYGKDREVAPFLSTHGKRGKSMAARILTTAMGEIGPRVASGNTHRSRLAELRLIQGVKMSSFDSKADDWFDLLVDDPDSAESLMRVTKVPTEDAYNKFKALLARARGAWVRPLAKFLSYMDAGKFNSEFRKFYGPSSQVSELFSSFNQGATYLSEDFGILASDKTALTRTQKENAVAGKTPPDNKKGKGKNRTVMLTGDTAKVLGKKQYASVKLSELSDGDLDKLYKLVVKKGSDKEAGSGSANAKYLKSLSPREKSEILTSMARHYGISTREAENELIDRDAEALYEYLAADPPLAHFVLREFRQMHLASDKDAKRREYGMYGYQARTASLGLSACSEIKETAGRVAAKLHGRKASEYEKITGFLKMHSTKGKCMYSKMLHSSYPDADRKCASAMPKTVEGWLKEDL